ncbi:hypothetical protein BS78_03G188300 [Paspalum vaginatum]|nr:hypothetical protein BS78_03G188300 [Paspalum vaginatum]
MARNLSEVSSAVAACARRLTRRLLRGVRERGLQLRLRLRLRRGGSSVCLGRHLVSADGGGREAGGSGDRDEDVPGQASLWRRAILMGQRCEPLDFPDAIHYDSFGRRVQSLRSGSGKTAGALFCRSSDAVDEAVAAAEKVDRYA